MSISGLPPLHLVIELVRAAEAANAQGVASGEWNRYLLRDPDGSGQYEQGELLWDESMQADLSATADLASAHQAVERLAASMRAFVAGAAWNRIAVPMEAARAAGRAVVLTVRSAAHELYALPWELVDINGTPACETADCLVRYECPGAGGNVTHTAAQPDQRMPPEAGGRILIAWSAAGGGVPAAEHIEAIAAAARAGNVPFERARDVVPSASLEALEAALDAGARLVAAGAAKTHAAGQVEHPPVTILHLLCHGEALPDGSAYGLRLDGAAEPISPARMRALLEPYRHTLRLVVLAACMGSNPGAADNALGSVAQAIHQAGVPAVIASRYPLTTAGLVLLAERLYWRLFVELSSLEQAFLDVRAGLRARLRQPGEPRDLDWASMQLYGRAALGLDFRPWIIRPYRGLEAFGREHRRFFFGRDRERRELCRRVADALAHGAPRFLLVAGASGTGKSSLVLAGLIPDLEAGRMRDDSAADAPSSANTPAWSTIVMRPGEGGAPADALARCLDEHRRARAHAATETDSTPRARSMLALVVDQLEELFTAVADQGQREAFLRALWRLATDPASDVFVIATIRIEYMGRFGTVRMDDAGTPFDRALLDGERHYLVRQMVPEQHERAIRGPAEAVGVMLEPGLVGRLLAALRAEPGALPLLSYTLDQLWLRRSFATLDLPWPGSFNERIPVTGWWLTDHAYEQLGGVEGALATTADALFARLGPAHQSELRRVLVQLVYGHEDPMLATRRRGWRLAMQPDPATRPEAARAYDQVIDALVAARLVVQGSAPDAGAQPWLELAHDSLIRFWPRFHAWYQDARDWLARTDELRDMARAWQPHARGHDATAAAREYEEPYLLRGQRLAYQREMWQRHGHQLGAQDQRMVQAFLDACARAEAERQAQLLAQERAARRRVQLLAASAVVVAVVMSVLGLWARSQQREAEAQRTLAESERDGKERQRAIAEDQAIAARDASLMIGARELLGRNQPRWATKLLLAVSRPAQARGWSGLVSESLAIPSLASTLEGHEGTLSMATFSPDGTRVLTASGDGTARIWRTDGTGQPVVLRGHGGPLRSALFRADGQYVVTASEDGTARVWRADGTGQPVVLKGHEEQVNWAAFSPDGQRVVTASEDGTARIWRADGTGQPVVLKASRTTVWWADFSPDGRFVATVDPWQATLWRADGVGEGRRFLPARRGTMIAAAFSPDSTLAITLELDGSAQVWRTDGTGQPLVLPGPGTQITAVAFSPDNRLMATISADDIVRVWRLDGTANKPVVLEGSGAIAHSVAFSPDSTRVAAALDDGTARIWRVDGKGQPLILDPRDRRPNKGQAGTLPSPCAFTVFRPRCTFAMFSPDGTRVLTSWANSTAQVWRIDSAGQPFALQQHPGAISSAAFSPDGTRAATASADGTVRIWRVDGTGEPVQLPGNLAVFSPDGQHVVTAESYTVTLWRADGTGEPVVLGQHQFPIMSAVFSPDGTRVLTTADGDDTARIWPTGSMSSTGSAGSAGEPVVLRGHQGNVWWAVFSPDGTRIATSSIDGTVRIWRADGTGEPTVLYQHDRPIGLIAFSPDGSRLLTALYGDQERARIWRMDGSGQYVAFQDYKSSISSAVFSPDSTRIVMAAMDGTVRISPADGTGEPMILQGHQGAIWSVSISPDGTQVVTASSDGTARVWRIDGMGEPVIWRHGAEVSVAVLSPDGRQVLTGAADGAARIWSLDIEMLRSALERANTDCLLPELRQDYLGESAEQAAIAYKTCEHAYGRIPAKAEHPAK